MVCTSESRVVVLLPDLLTLIPFVAVTPEISMVAPVTEIQVLPPSTLYFMVVSTLDRVPLSGSVAVKVTVGVGARYAMPSKTEAGQPFSVVYPKAPTGTKTNEFELEKT